MWSLKDFACKAECLPSFEHPSFSVVDLLSDLTSVSETPLSHLQQTQILELVVHPEITHLRLRFLWEMTVKFAEFLAVSLDQL